MRQQQQGNLQVGLVRTNKAEVTGEGGRPAGGGCGACRQGMARRRCHKECHMPQAVLTPPCTTATPKSLGLPAAAACVAHSALGDWKLTLPSRLSRVSTLQHALEVERQAVDVTTGPWKVNRARHSKKSAWNRLKTVHLPVLSDCVGTWAVFCGLGQQNT